MSAESRPSDWTPDRLVTAQARARPNRVAGCHGGDRLTYGELDEAAGRVAAALAAKGVGPGHRIGLALEPGLPRGVVLLGVMRSGAAYVPLDPAYPRARLELMADDAELSSIIASPGIADLFEGLAPVFGPDELATAPVPPMRDSRATTAAPAYLIYTSGSTGRPKGVVLPHRALRALTEWHLEQPGFGEPLRTLQFSALSFDIHAYELLTTWSAGGEILFVDEGVKRDPARLLRLLVNEGVHKIFLAPVALQQLAEVATTHGPLPTALREVLSSGEQLQVNDVVRDFFERLPGCRLHNHYGPSETHVVTAHTLDGPPESWPLLPSIGTAISGSRVVIVDEAGRPVPEGEEGELWAGGLCLADGYWRRPELTAERFVSGPDGERMYRTGDLTRMGASGAIDYLGRIDHQVKIRGHRVEPAEVESAMLEHPGVRECAVAARDDGQGGRRLVAYLVLDSTRPGMRDRVEALVAEKLAQWREVWEEAYDGAVGDDTPELDLRGWVDSVHGRPIPEEEMEIWARGTASQVLALRPRRVLELGVGTGLMLHRIAPHCEAYHGTDFSPRAVELLRRRTAARELCPELRLDVAAAHEVERFRDQEYDLVLLNSVTQAFPTVEYLVDVLKGAARLLRRGHIVVGDVTSATLREAFHTSVEAARARGDESVAALAARVERRLGREEELVVDPAFFDRLAEWVPEVSAVEVRLKPGRYRNELSRFRYDVIVEVGGRRPLVEPREVPWSGAVPDGPTLAALLEEGDGVAVLEGIPNARVIDAVERARALASREGDTVAEWRLRCAARVEARVGEAVDPADLVERTRELGVAATPTWSDDLDRFDLVLKAASRAAELVDRRRVDDGRSVGRLASQPMNVALMPQIEAELRRRFDETMPAHMIPDRFELLARLPTSPSGKLDRRSLPEPGRHRPALPHDYVPPRGATEHEVAAIWSEILSIDRIGATDSFFDLGGNSILSVRLAALLRSRMARDLPLVTIFHYPTVRAMAGFLDGSAESAASLGNALDERAARQRGAFARHRRLRRD